MENIKYVELNEQELEDVNGGIVPLLVIGGGLVLTGLAGWGAYNGYQSAARGGK